MQVCVCVLKGVGKSPASFPRTLARLQVSGAQLMRVAGTLASASGSWLQAVVTFSVIRLMEGRQQGSW